MKMNNKNIFKVAVILLLIGMIGTFTHCGVQMAKEVGDGGGSSSYSSNGSNTPKNEGQIINETQVTTGMKNHEQILQTMGAVTGIDPFTVNSIMTAYRGVEMSLPTDNDIKVFSSTQQVAITKLAAAFCETLSNDTTRRANLWTGVNFGQAPAQGLANRTLFINQTLTAFWGPLDMHSTDEIEAAHDDLDDLITMLSPTGTRNTVKGVCTAVLSSAYVTLI